MEKLPKIMKEQVYHILITDFCGRECPLCCNRLYDLDNLPTVTGEMLRTAHTVCLTGGEPLNIGIYTLIKFCHNIRKQYPNIQKLYIYTSGAELELIDINYWKILSVDIDGINVSPKNRNDWDGLRRFSRICNHLISERSRALSNRLYIFQEQQRTWDNICDITHLSDNWQVIGRKWDREFKTPENEHFVRLPILY